MEVVVTLGGSMAILWVITMTKWGRWLGLSIVMVIAMIGWVAYVNMAPKPVVAEVVTTYDYDCSKPEPKWDGNINNDDAWVANGAWLMYCDPVHGLIKGHR
jgi:hypothetical protein